jgi:hypothetical protein
MSVFFLVNSLLSNFRIQINTYTFYWCASKIYFICAPVKYSMLILVALVIHHASGSTFKKQMRNLHTHAIATHANGEKVATCSR